MSDKPLVSIALCTYNGDKYLAEQLDTLVNQNYPNLEIIIVDDKSNDTTWQILENYAAQYSFINLYKNEVNLGYKKNFEKAIKFCTGEYIALSDQDDIWKLDKIEKMVNAIGDAVLIYHDSEFVNHNGLSLNKRMSDILNMYSGDSFKPFLFFNCVSGHALMIKKSVVNQIVPFPKEIMHDQWMAFCAANLGEITYLPEALVLYRQHESSDTNILKLDRKEVTKKVSSKDKIIKFCKQLDAFKAFSSNKDKTFIEKLRKAYYKKLTSLFAVSLVFLMYKNFSHLLFIYKKSTLSKLNFIYKHIWGIKLKSS